MYAEKLKQFDQSDIMPPPIEDGYLDALMLDGVDFEEYLYKRETDGDAIKPPSFFRDDVLKRFAGQGHFGATLPWTKTHEWLRFRNGEVTMWSGYNGHKKSMVLGYVSLGFMLQNEPVCIASFEMQPASTIARMVKQSLGVKEPTECALDKFIATYEKRLWIYNQHGGVEPNRLYGVIYYAAEKLGCKHFIIDSLMRVIPGEDSYNEQKDFVVKLCEIAAETNIHIHFVHHARGGDESKPAGRYDAKGSKAISDNVHNAINVWSQKDKESDQDKPDVILTCDKQREGEWEGSIALWFVPECMQFCGTQDRSIRQWLKL